MKKIFYITLTFVLAVFLISCEPIEKRDGMGETVTADQIKLSIANTTTVNGKNGNQITVQNGTPHFYGQWDLLVRQSFKTQDTVILPFKGKITIPFKAITAGGFVNTSIDVTIDTIDHPVDPAFAILAGTTSAGKTWVWSNGPNRFAMTAGNPNDVWWSLSLQDIIDNKVAEGTSSELKFDLNGKANCTLYPKKNDPNAVVDGLAGNFTINLTSTPRTLTIGGNAHIPGWDFRAVDGSANAADWPLIKGQVYNIVSLTDTELKLWMNLPATGQGWLWVFMPKP
jgi:hypothetical protein